MLVADIMARTKIKTATTFDVQQLRETSGTETYILILFQHCSVSRLGVYGLNAAQRGTDERDRNKSPFSGKIITSFKIERMTLNLLAI